MTSDCQTASEHFFFEGRTWVIRPMAHSIVTEVQLEKNHIHYCHECGAVWNIEVADACPNCGAA